LCHRRLYVDKEENKLDRRPGSLEEMRVALKMSGGVYCLLGSRVWTQWGSRFEITSRMHVGGRDYGMLAVVPGFLLFLSLRLSRVLPRAGSMPSMWVSVESEGFWMTF
jgi:hypothetical protein